MFSILWNKVTTFIGYLLEGIAMIGFLAWLQSSDPDCIFSSDVFVQLRICDPEVVGEPKPLSLVHFTIILVTFLIGFLLLRFSSKAQKSKQETDQESHQSHE